MYELGAQHGGLHSEEVLILRSRGAEIQAWPLVKVACLRHNWKVLESGAVLVDLPGTRDANAQRGAVAGVRLGRILADWVARQ